MMTKFISLRRLLSDCKGASAIEYGLIVALIALVIAGGAGELGNEISGMLTNVATRVSNVALGS